MIEVFVLGASVLVVMFLLMCLGLACAVGVVKIWELFNDE